MTVPEKQARNAPPRIMAAAAKLFVAKGVRQVSLDDVAQEAGVTKKTIYYHFGSKDALVAAWLGASSDAAFAAMARLPDEPRTAIRRVFAALVPATAQRPFSGCFYVRTALETEVPNSQSKRAASRHKQKRRDWFCAQLTLAGHGHPDDGAAELCVIWDGALALAVLLDDGTPAQAALRMVERILGDCCGANLPQK